MPKSILFDKHQVIEKVTQLFWEKGYNGTSMQDLVDVTGLNRSSFYNTFKGGKFELLIEALKYYQTTEKQRLDYLKQMATTPREVIVLLFESVNEGFEKGNTKGCFIANSTAELANLDANISIFLKNHMTNVVEVFKNLIQEGQKLGEIDENKNAETLAQYLYSSFQGLHIVSMIDKNPKHIRNISSQILEVL